MKNLITLSTLLLVITGMAQTKFNAVIVGENVRMRSEANTKASITKAMNTGDVFSIIDKNEERVILPLNQNMCDDFGYYWYKINTADNKTGWVFGAFVYLLNQKDNVEPSIKKKEFIINKKQFYFNTATVESYGPADENGLTGCDENSLPFFYDNLQNKVFPIKMNFTDSEISYTSIMCTKDKSWMILYSGEGGNDFVGGIKQIENALEMTVNRSFQDGDAIAILLLTFNGSYFEATVKSYETIPAY